MHKNPAILQVTKSSSSDVAILKLTILFTMSLSKITVIISVIIISLPICAANNYILPICAANNYIPSNLCHQCNHETF